jgi:hypothetical protein
MSRRVVAAGLVGMSLTLATTGCGAGKKSDQLPKDMQRITDVHKYISIGVPKSWTPLDLSTEQLDPALQRVGITDPGVKGAVQGLQHYGALYALDPRATTSPSHVGTFVNAFCIASTMTSTAPLKEGAAGQLQNIGAQNVQVTDTTVDGHPAIRSSYGLKPPNGSADGRQVQALAKGRLCTITFSTDQIGRYETVFNAMIPTIKLT